MLTRKRELDTQLQSREWTPPADGRKNRVGRGCVRNQGAVRWEESVLVFTAQGDGNTCNMLYAFSSLLHKVCVCVRVHTYICSNDLSCLGWMSVCGSQVFPSTIWDPRLELRLSGFDDKHLTSRAISSPEGRSSTVPNVMARWTCQSPSSAHCERNTTP